MRVVRFDIQGLAEENPLGLSGYRTSGGLVANYLHRVYKEVNEAIRRRYPVNMRLKDIRPSGVTEFLGVDRPMDLPRVEKCLMPGKLSLAVYMRDEDEDLHREIASVCQGLFV